MRHLRLSATRRILLASILLSCVRVAAAAHPELKAFPPATEGMERFVIVLPDRERGEEDAFQVELVAGMTILTDGVNRMRLGTTLEPRPLQGWGYTYYQVSGSDVAMSTMMAPPEGAPRVEQFVPGTPIQIRYNSRLPIVVYAPKGYEVRYRIWQASQTFTSAEKE